MTSMNRWVRLKALCLKLDENVGNKKRNRKIKITTEKKIFKALLKDRIEKKNVQKKRNNLKIQTKKEMVKTVSKEKIRKKDSKIKEERNRE